MRLENAMAYIFGMDDKTWQKHANPASVWTRYLTLPLLVLIIWTRIWIGFWYLPLVGLGLIWLFLNPRIFPKPKTTRTWAAKLTLGERVWLAKNDVPIPTKHAFMAKWLALFGKLSMIYLIYGMIYLNLQATLLGLLLVNIFKSWFGDRMVWLYEDMKHIPKYASWLY